MKIREYLKLARSFNAVLTGISPVMGALAMQEFDLVLLLLLFCVGFFGHTFGFVFNDIVDFNIDKTSKEISDRPLVSGTISLGKAWAFAFFALILAFVFAFIISFLTGFYLPIFVLALSGFLIAVYDLISKKYPFTDIFVALGVFFLIVYGASTVAGNIQGISILAWIVGVLGSIQVLFMQIVAGGMKDIENDFKKGAKTLAIALGVRVIDGKLHVSPTFKFLAYGLQLVDLIIVFIPFIILSYMQIDSWLQYLQWALLGLIGLVMFVLSHALLSMPHFERFKARKYIGSHYMINFMLVPIMLMTLNPWVGLITIIPGLGFIFSNIFLHGTLLQPKTM